VTETVLQLENITVSENVTREVKTNVTYLVNVTNVIETQQPVDVVIALDASHSVSDSSWAAENQAGRELLRGLRDSLTGDLRAGVAVWANDGAVRQTLTEVDEATVDAMADFARLPYCGAVPGPYSPKAEQYSQAFCEGDPPGVQDADHAYDLRHDSTMGLIGVHTYYAQALLKCFEELTGADDAFKLCVVVTDGQISEDRYAQCDAGIRRATMTYTSAMSGDFYDAGAELYRVDGDPVCTDGLADNRWISPAAFEFCQSRSMTDCTVDSITDALKAAGIKVLNVLVSETEDQSSYEPRMSELSSCDSTMLDPDCPYLQAQADFASLALAASNIAEDVAVLVETVTTTVEETELVTEEITEVQTSQEEVTREVEVESIETRTSEELVTKTEKSTEPTEVTESTTTQKTICTGSPISFTLLVLVLPFLVYLFLKPLLNCLENCCCPRSQEDAEPLVMHANPAFGLDLEASQARAAARAPRRRSTIDKMLMRARHLRKKKNVGDADPAAAPAPLRTAAPVTTEQPTRRRSAVAALARDAETEWASGVAAVYDGDDWQESVADFVLGLLFCRTCRSSAEPAEGKNPFEEESKEDLF
jgi:hypothetical protein